MPLPHHLSLRPSAEDARDSYTVLYKPQRNTVTTSSHGNTVNYSEKELGYAIDVAADLLLKHWAKKA